MRTCLIFVLIMNGCWSHDVTMDMDTVNTTVTNETTMRSIVCGQCPKLYVGGPSTYFSDKLIRSQDVNAYSMCKQKTPCSTVITVPDGYYVLLAFGDLYMVPGDTLTMYDGDNGQDEKKILARFGADDSGGAAVESYGNNLTMIFEFRYYGGHYPQSYYRARYNAIKADCLCHEPSSTQTGVVKFQSPNYPHYYCPQSQCEYFVNISHNDASAYCGLKPILGITLSFTTFDLEPRDSLSVFTEYGMDEELLIRYSGQTETIPIMTHTNFLKITFDGTYAGAYTGFKAVAKIECGHAIPSIDSGDALEITMGTLAAVGLCFLGIVVIVIVALVAARERRRWSRIRVPQNSYTDPSVSIIGPLPSYNDALRCMKWEAVTVNSESGQPVQMGASFSPVVPAGEPPPYMATDICTVQIHMDIAGGQENHGFNDDETPNELSIASSRSNQDLNDRL